MTCTDLCTALLPPQAPLHIETLGMTERGMTLDVAVTTPQAHCPTCTQPSHIPSLLVVRGIPVQRKPPDVRICRWLLLDSRVVDVLRLSNLMLVTLSSLKPFFCNGLKKE